MRDEQSIIQNLRDSGCGEETVTRIYGLYQAGLLDDAIRSLRSFRCGLIEELHESQSKVDCLDYLVHRLQKEAQREAKKTTTTTTK